ncbi:hypothetical protein PMI41_01724 [Phyllobacterium sp. YR531]|nr:hypothetical protein PMI41_01724 [Phyllobacterium sp. YR531]
MLPLLQRHPDLALIGRMLVLTPVRNVLSFICIDRRSNPNIFVVDTAVTLSFLRLTNWPLSGGRLLYIHQRMWDIRDPESIELLRNMIEEALPELRQINSIDDYIHHRINDPENSRYFVRNHGLRAIAALANGDLKMATAFIDEGIASGLLDRTPDYYPALIACNRAALLKNLHERQAFTIKNLKLEKYWEPTPFPLELPVDKTLSD